MLLFWTGFSKTLPKSYFSCGNSLACMEVDKEVAVFQMLSKGHWKMGKGNVKLFLALADGLLYYRCILEGCYQDNS